MRYWTILLRLWKQSDGFILATERVLLLTMALCVLVISITALRISLRSFFLDELDAIAACSNQVTFDTGSASYRNEETTDFSTLFPNLTDNTGTRPTPVDASKE